MIKKKGLLICFTGIDGSGKTTLAKNLTEHYSKSGLPIKYVYARYQLRMAKPIVFLGNKLVLRRYDSNCDYNGCKSHKQYINKKFKILSFIYLYFLLFDYILQLIVKIRLPLLQNKIVICDRYIYDTIITDFSVDMNLSNNETIILINNCLKIIPKPNILIYVDVDEEVAYNRKNDVISIDYLIDRKIRYINTLKAFNMIQVNGNMAQNDVFSECKRRIENEFN